MKIENDWKKKVQKCLDAYEKECEYIYSKVEKQYDGRVIAALAVSVAAIYRKKLLAILLDENLFLGRDSIRKALRNSLELGGENANCGSSYLGAMMNFAKIFKSVIQLDSAEHLFFSAPRST